MVYTELAPKRQHFMWHQPCNNHRALPVHHFREILIIRAIKGCSHSFRITCDMCAVSLLESRGCRYVKAMNNNKGQDTRGGAWDQSQDTRVGAWDQGQDTRGGAWDQGQDVRGGAWDQGQDIGRGVGHGIRGWVAQLVERGTETPGAVLTQVRFPSATKYFFPVNF